MKREIPSEVRQLASDLAYHDISLRKVSTKAKVGYSDASRILNGWLRHPEKFEKLVAAFEKLKGVAA